MRQRARTRRHDAIATSLRTAGLRSSAGLALLILAASVLAGCGSSAGSVPPPPATNVQTQSTADPATSSASAAAPNTDGPPSFVVQATTKEGDRVKVEGWFGPPLPASESDVDQTALSECPPPAPDGRAMVVRLDLATTLESSLSGEVELETSYLTGKTVNFVMGFSEGPQCDNGQPGYANIKLGTLQPGESHTFTMWVILPDAITPDDPHPSEQTLGSEHWFMVAPEPSVNGSSYLQDQHNSLSGPRVVTCPRVYEASEQYLAVVGDTSTTLHESVCPVE